MEGQIKFHDFYKKASDIVNGCEEGYVSVIEKSGYPHVATRSNIKPNGLERIYFSTGTEGRMAEAIRNNEKMSVCFHRGNDNVTLDGRGWIVTDSEEKKSVWVDWFINHFPGGVEDPGFCVVGFEPINASLWIDRTVVTFQMEELKNVVSRCGLLCNHCEFREPYHCGGCIATNGNPFYGACRLASCTQERGYTHCGQCEDIPCEILKEFSLGEGEHCDNPKGSRIEILKLWKNKNNSPQKLE